MVVMLKDKTGTALYDATSRCVLRIRIPSAGTRCAAFIDCSSTGAHPLQTQVLDLHPQIQALLHQADLNANRSKWL